MKINIGKVVTGFLAFFMALIEFVLVFRFVLKLFAASSTADFTLTIYNTSNPLIAPFEGVFPAFEVANFTLEISTLLAMIVYGIVGAIFYMLARNIGGVSIKQGQTSNQPLITPNQPQTPQQSGPPSQQPTPYQQPQTPQQSQAPQPNAPYKPPLVQQTGVNPPTGQANQPTTANQPEQPTQKPQNPPTV